VFINSGSIDKDVDIIELDVLIQVQAPNSSFICKFQ